MSDPCEITDPIAPIRAVREKYVADLKRLNQQLAGVKLKIEQLEKKIEVADEMLAAVDATKHSEGSPDVG